MSEHGWIAHHRSEFVDILQENYPCAYLLLSQIARRARIDPCSIRGLKQGEAMIGDFKKAGIPSRQKYRSALKTLIDNHQITIRTTTKGTIARLCSVKVYTLTSDERKPTNNHQITNEQPSSNHQVTTNNKVIKKEGKKKEESLPLPFDSIEFKTSWEEWLSYLNQKRKTPTKITKTKQLKILAGLIETDAIMTINKSITNGWQGIFPPKDKLELSEPKHAKYAREL